MQPYQVKKAYELAEKFQARLQRDLYCAIQPMKAVFAPTDRAMGFGECDTLEYKAITPGEVWGRTWQNGWFKFSGSFARVKEKNLIPACRINTGSEALLYDVNGKALSGLTAYCWFKDDFIREIYYPGKSAPASGLEFKLYCAVTANKLAGLDVDYDPPFGAEVNGSFEARFKCAETLWVRSEVQQLIYDVKVLRSLASVWAEKDYRRRDIAEKLNKAENIYADDFRNASAAREVLAPLLKRRAADSALSVTAIGHSHLDTAYMWPVKEGIQKCGRTFATQMELIENSSDYIFGASQPQHYAFVKQYFPELYERIKVAVAEGRWEVQGGMWVEADTNVPDGEALVRQFLHGKNFFKDEFNIEVRNLWLPDVFGYTAAMPQIMKLANCNSFVSIKLSGNDCNKFPHNTFRWRGIDKSEVLAHFPPEGFYSSFLQPDTLCKAQDNYAESSETGAFLSLFGMGDGGAGAVRDDLEAGRRLADLEGAPKVKFAPAQELLDYLNNCFSQLPIWDGELYLERHRGSTTSAARFKRDNRKSEQLLPAVEFLCSAIRQQPYPIKQLDKAWKLLLLFQFHDIIAGTSLDETYEEAAAAHKEIRQLAAECVNNAVKMLPSEENTLTLVNSLNTTWRGSVTLSGEWGGCTLIDASGKAMPYTINEDGSSDVSVELEPMSFTAFNRSGLLGRSEVLTSIAPVLENEYIAYTFNNDLQIVSAYDKITGRELIPSRESGNRLALYRDYPSNYEAWDLERHYRDRQAEYAVNTAPYTAIKRWSDGSSEISAWLKAGNSMIYQRIKLASSGRQLDFITQVDWQKERRMLRVEFPTVIQNDHALYDIQFGAYKRPTCENAPIELAKFEVQLHKFMDLSESNYGVALLNDCKYGGRVFDSTLELTLLRSAKFPSLKNENGTQIFKYAFLPHIGTAETAQVAEAAEVFNRDPLMLFNVDAADVKHGFKLDNCNVALVACKRAEKSDDLIVRLVERYGCEQKVTLDFDRTVIASAGECDLMEWQESSNPATEGKLELIFKPY